MLARSDSEKVLDTNNRRRVSSFDTNRNELRKQTNIYQLAFLFD